MIEHKQLYFHKPAEGEIGDCFRTSIACILNMEEPDDVPHVYELAWKDGEVVSTDAHKLLNEWLKESYPGQNLRYFEYPLECDREQLGRYLKHYFPDMFVLIGCNSKHGGHSVVMRNDDYMWDPSKDNSGCVGPMSDGHYWVGILIKETK